MRISIPIECNNCKKRRGYKKQNYTPKDIKKIPNKPVAKCKLCNRYIVINRNYIIDFINKKLKKSSGSSQTQTSLIDQDYQLKQEILKYISRADKSYHGYLISKKLNIHYSTIYKHINWLKDNGYIIQTSTRPNFFQLSSAGKFYMKYGITDVKTFKQIQNKEKDDRINKYLGIIKEYIHNLSFRLPLDTIPNWLKAFNPIRKTNGKYRGQSKKIKNKKYFFKPIPLKNWKRPKYYFYTNKVDYGGIESVEINIDNVAFNFNRDRKDCLVSSTSGFINYFEEREKDVIKCKNELNRIGFKIIGDEPILHKKPHIVIKYKDDISDLKGLGKWVNAKLKGSNLEIDLDNSPKKDGETEMGDVKKALDIIKIPEKIEDLEDKIKDIEGKITTIDQIIDSQNKQNDKLDKIEKAIIIIANQNQQTNDNIKNLTDQFKDLNDNFSNLLKLIQPDKIDNSRNQDQKEKNSKMDNNYFL